MSNELEFAGIKFRGGKLVGILIALSTLVGGAYSAFEVYKDYMDMKEVIKSYEPPDLTGFESRLNVFEEKTTNLETVLNNKISNMDNTLETKIANMEQILQSEISTALELVQSAQGDARDIRNELRKDINEVMDNISAVDKRSRLTEQEIRGSQRTAENDVRTLIAAVNNAKIPPMESVPLLKPASKTAQAKNDYMELTPTGKKARDILSSNPVYINDTVIPYFKELAEQWSKSTTNFTTFAKGIAGDNELLYSIFGVNSVSEFSEELSDSIRGQNQSKLVPLEDFLNNINSFTKDDKSLGLYMNYNLVRNARFNMDNSIMNTQGSKYMRHLIGSAQYSIDTINEDVTRHYIDSIMDQIGEVNIDFGLDKTSDNYDQELFDVLVGISPV